MASDATLHADTFRAHGASSRRSLRFGGFYPGENMMNEERAKFAYDTFRDGLKNPDDIPTWEKATSLIRDIAMVAYLQGMLDGFSKKQR